MPHLQRYGYRSTPLHDCAAARFASMGATGSVLTITHSRELAIAHVLLLIGSR
jgi:hypothetical protein